jgi:cytochrome c-type biogenesis protein CcmH/NrfG
MRWIPTLTLLLALAGGVFAAGPDDDYLAIYSQIQQADGLQRNGQSTAALTLYLKARDALQKYHTDYPFANAAAVNFRLDYLADRLKELGGAASSTNASPSSASAKPFSALTPQQQAAASLQELTNAYAQLYMKYKEATSVQPAALAPGELDKAQEQIKGLEKERDLLTVALDQQRAANAAGAKPAASTGTDLPAQTEIARLKRELDAAQRKLSDSEAELKNLKARPAAQRPVAGNLQQLTAENDQLKKDLDAVKKELADREAHAGAPAATPSQPAPAAAASSAELERLRARLAVLEAAAVPYTAEELAVLKSSPARVAVPPVAANPTAAQAHSIKDLSSNALTVIRDAEMDVRAKHYEDAEKKYTQVLEEDGNNIYVLANLGTAQFAAGHLDDCEKTVSRALALDPNDPGSLYLLGMLRYRQEKLDDALDAFSRSASLNATNAGTQNYLGCVLADKGLRSQAETALRKALQLDPNYADAHFNLALVYAAETPPSMALARFEYGKALELGHEKNASLEKMLSDAK